jgi:hypothetical protein
VLLLLLLLDAPDANQGVSGCWFDSAHDFWEKRWLLNPQLQIIERPRWQRLISKLERGWLTVAHAACGWCICWSGSLNHWH